VDVAFTPAADRQLSKLPEQVQVRIVTAIMALADDPRPAGVRKLAGPGDLYRIRTGDYRVIYEVRDDELLVLIVRVGHRRDVYR
jgi:mRNA interferase RelE/StbE